MLETPAHAMISQWEAFWDTIAYVVASQQESRDAEKPK